MPHYTLLGHYLPPWVFEAQFSLAGTLQPLRGGVVAAWGWDGWGRESDPSLGGLWGQRDLPASHGGLFLLPIFPGVGTPTPTHFPKILPSPPLVLKITYICTHLFNKYWLNTC